MRKSCIPNVFTFINLSCGVLSILALFEGDGNFALSGLLIILAGLVDRYDGRIARYLQVSSELGKELDSLADLVSFGVAPSILIYKLFDLNSFGPSGILGLAVLLTFPICGAFRLARYNTSSFDGVFTGVPITIAGSFMALFAIIGVYVETIPVLVPILLMFAFSYLMVSNFRLKKV